MRGGTSMICSAISKRSLSVCKRANDVGACICDVSCVREDAYVMCGVWGCKFVISGENI